MATVNEIKFGTDGWRGVIAEVFTFKNVEVVAQAVAEWINQNVKAIDGVKSVCVGYDNRFLSPEFAETVSCVLAANNIKIYLSDTSLPTPALSFGVTRKKSVAGIMITASHNPGKFNGIKIKTAQGGAAGKDITDVVEKFLYKTDAKKADLAAAQKAGDIVVLDFKAEYVRFIRNYIDFKKVKNAKFKVIQDVMHGSGRDLLRQMLKGSKMKLEIIRSDLNPSFEGGKPEPVPEYLIALINRLKKEKWDLGLVLDGDADRIAAVAPGGQFISPQKILGLLILHLVRNRGVEGGIVKTLCGTTMLDKIAAKLNRKLYETPVGFKYISDLMVTKKIVAGGEEAGGMGLPNYIPERDGSLAGLLLVEMMVYQKKNIKQLLSDMEKEFGAYFYERLDLTIDRRACDLNKIKSIPGLLGKAVVKVQDIDGVKLTCEDESWLMFRPSGTEPLVRIYSEAKSLKKAKDLIAFGRKFLEASLRP
jgi:alpha-D-glucose phosphate-specific phosphoglucomutase